MKRDHMRQADNAKVGWPHRLGRLFKMGLLALIALGAVTACSPTLPTIFDSEVTADDRAARRFAKLLTAAERGDQVSQHKLARAYERGDGAPRDLTKAHQWYLAAAQTGYVRAMRPLGDLYADGEGVPTNPARAQFWYERAVQFDDSVAAHRLAKMLLAKEAVAGSSTGAVALIRKSAQGGYVPAQLDLAAMYDAGTLVPADPAEADRWYAIARTALTNEAADDDATALQRLGDLHRDGLGVPANAAKAAGFYEQAAGLGRVSAVVRLAKLYDRGGPGVAPDPAQAAVYYTRAKDAGDSNATLALAKKYARGEGVPVNGALAFELFETVVQNGDERAYAGLGELLADPDTSPTNYAAALEWYERAARTGDGKSMFKIAELLSETPPRPTDEAEILSWYLRALDFGYDRAASRIDRLKAALDRAAFEKARLAAEAYASELSPS